MHPAGARAHTPAVEDLAHDLRGADDALDFDDDGAVGDEDAVARVDALRQLGVRAAYARLARGLVLEALCMQRLRPRV
jgi:hypothetical protein